ncbi:hypothetical protein ACA910_021681 [Epithemia clementina (nom. ined.)]
MGNTASSPKETDQNDQQLRGSTKPPQDWNDGKSFVMISPQSDLSNPSQFRHRVRESQAGLADLQAASRALVPRHYQRRSGSVPPPPATFYFDQENQTENHQNIKTQEHHHAKWMKQKKRTVKNKAKRAKRVFKSCWEEKREALHCCVRENQPAHERLKSLTPRPKSSIGEQASVFQGRSLQQDAPQLVLPSKPENDFHPVFQDKPHDTSVDQGNDEIRAYLHNEKIFVDRLTVKNNPEPRTPYARANPETQPCETRAVLDDKIADRDGDRSSEFPGGKIEYADEKLSEERQDMESKMPSFRATNQDEELAKLCGNVVTKCRSCDDHVLHPNDVRRKETVERKTDTTVANEADEKETKSVPSNKSRTLGSGTEPIGNGKLDNGFSPSLLVKSKMMASKTMVKERRFSYPQDFGDASRDHTNSPGATQTIRAKNPKTLSSKTTALVELRNDNQATTNDGPTQNESSSGSMGLDRGGMDSLRDSLTSTTMDHHVEEMKAPNKKQSSTDEDQPGNPNEVEKYFLHGSTMQQMLLQTYPIASTCAQGSEESAIQPRSKLESLVIVDGTTALVSSESPVASTSSSQTPQSDSSQGMVSIQAIRNAAFLFSPSYADGDKTLLRLPVPQQEATPFSISTGPSQNRLVSLPRRDPQQYVPSGDEDSSSALARTVRFPSSNKSSQNSDASTKKERRTSEVTDPGDVHVQSIPRNLSDLTDSTGFTRASLTGLNQMGINPIIEEDEKDSVQADTESSATFDHPSVDSPPDEEETNEPSPSSAPAYPSNWSYSVDMDNGVTPLRNGKLASNATHSPFLRFTQAKKKFSGENEMQEQESESNDQGEKRESHCHSEGSLGLVRSRIVAMERASQSNSSRGPSSGSASDGSLVSRKIQRVSKELGGQTSIRNFPSKGTSSNYSSNEHGAAEPKAPETTCIERGPTTSSSSTTENDDVPVKSSREVESLDTFSNYDVPTENSVEINSARDASSGSTHGESLASSKEVDGSEEKKARTTVPRRSSTGTISDRSFASRKAMFEKISTAEPSSKSSADSRSGTSNVRRLASRIATGVVGKQSYHTNSSTFSNKGFPSLDPTAIPAVPKKETFSSGGAPSPESRTASVHSSPDSTGSDTTCSTVKVPKHQLRVTGKSPFRSLASHKKNASNGLKYVSTTEPAQQRRVSEESSFRSLASYEADSSKGLKEGSTTEPMQQALVAEESSYRSLASYDGDASTFSVGRSKRASTQQARVAEESSFRSLASYDGDASKLSTGGSTTDDSQRGSFNLKTIPKYGSLNHPQFRTFASDMASTNGSELDTTVDDFAALLQEGSEDEDSVDESTEDESSIEETVSTVRQVREVERMMSAEPAFSEEDDTTFFSDSLETVSTIRQTRETYSSAAASSTLSSVMKEEKASLPFRDSGTVRPTEQLHRTVPGALHLSPTQKTPLQARKWRALAAAAQEKTSISKPKFGSKPRTRLSERDTNIYE